MSDFGRDYIGHEARRVQRTVLVNTGYKRRKCRFGLLENKGLKFRLALRLLQFVHGFEAQFGMSICRFVMFISFRSGLPTLIFTFFLDELLITFFIIYIFIIFPFIFIFR